MATNKAFWDCLLSTIEAVENLDGSDQARRRELITLLDGLVLANKQAFDPIDNYEEYVALALCRAIRYAMSTND